MLLSKRLTWIRRIGLVWPGILALLIAGCGKAEQNATLVGVIFEAHARRVHAAVQVFDAKTGEAVSGLGSEAFSVNVDGQRMKPSLQTTSDLSHLSAKAPAAGGFPTYFVEFTVSETTQPPFEIHVDAGTFSANAYYAPDSGVAKYITWLLVALIASVTAVVLGIGRRALGLPFIFKPKAPSIHSDPSVTDSIPAGYRLSIPQEAPKIIFDAENEAAKLILNKPTLFATRNAEGMNCLAISSACVIGSQNQPSDLPVVILRDPLIEPLHVRLTFKDGQCRLQDVGKVRGVRVGEKLVPAQGLVLKEGDAILLGPLRFRVRNP